MRSLTDKQVAVLDLIAQGMTDKEIGKAMGLAPETVKGHTCRLLGSIGARNRTHAVALAYQAGLLKVPA
jgi:DNA-binding NarL/FixJ family response regulator